MSGNRFEFLEFGEDGASRPPAEAGERVDPSTLSPAREPQGPRDAEGRPLAQVRVDDLPGRGSYLSLRDQREMAAAAQASTSRTLSNLRVAEIIGSRGGLAGQFNFPTGLAVDRSGVLYVADSYNHRLQRITPTGGVAVIGCRGAGRGQFLSPQGVATDTRSAFYIVEQGNSRVQKFSAQGVLELIFGRSGRGEGELRSPTGIAVAPGSGDIYIADTGNSRVQRFDSEGNFLSTLGAAGGLYPALVSPQALAVDAHDNLYVADTFAQRIVRYDPLGRHLGPLASGQLREPRALAWDPLGVLYIADTAPGQDLNSQGRLQAFETKSGLVRATVKDLNGTGVLQRPGGLAISWTPEPELSAHPAFGDLYVADTMNHRVLRFAWN